MAGKRTTQKAVSKADDSRSPVRRLLQGRKRARVAALIVAADASRRVGDCVRAALSLPDVDLVIVIDDGSHDGTQDVARVAGANVVRHSHRRGRAACIETGLAVAGMRDEDGRAPRHLLILDANLGDRAVGAAPLLPPVVEGVTDLAIATVASVPGGRSQGMSAALARNAVERASGWAPDQPLSRIRCITREALEAALPLGHGGGLDVGMTLDVLLAGYSVTEVACEIHLRERPAGLLTPATRMNRYRDVMLAVSSRRIRGGIEATQHAVGDRILGGRGQEDDE